MDLAIYPYPLSEVSLDVAEGLQRTAPGTICGGCRKPFTVVRKTYGVVRAMYLSPEGQYYSWSWLLCRKCRREVMRNGNTVPDHLKREAEQEAALLMTMPGGIA